MTLNLLTHKNQTRIVKIQLGINHTALAEKGQHLMGSWVFFHLLIGLHKYPNGNRANFASKLYIRD